MPQTGIRRKTGDVDLSCNTHITVFSTERFSGWCVHEAKQNEKFHAVTLERLKY